MLRLAAFELLRADPVAPLRRLPAVADRHDLDLRDRALLRHLVGTGWRRLGTLRALTKFLVDGKPKPEVATFVHVGLVQVLFADRVPDHAAVGETVEACVQRLGLGKGRIVNAVLRRAIRMRREGVSGDPRRDLFGRDLHLDEPVFRDPDSHPHLWAEDALSMPAALMKAWVTRYGDERARELARFALEEPPLSLRVLRGEPDAVKAELELAGCTSIAERGPTLLFPSDATSKVLESAAFERGDVLVQGAAASKAAEQVRAQPGEEVLDLCAAPGGKSLLLANAGARVVASDVSKERLDRVAINAMRCNLGSNLELRVADAGGATEEAEGLGDRTFDAVLVDAPCSNTGVLAGRPEARWRFGPAQQKSLAELQARLFHAGAERVRPGGRLIWSTCSLEPSENAAQVRAFLRDRPEFELDEDGELLPDLGEARVDGGFAARLVRRS